MTNPRDPDATTTTGPILSEPPRRHVFFTAARMRLESAQKRGADYGLTYDLEASLDEIDKIAADLAAERALRQQAEARAGEMASVLRAVDTQYLALLADPSFDHRRAWPNHLDGLRNWINEVLATPTADHAAKGEADAS